MTWYLYSIATALCYSIMYLCNKHLGNKGFQAKQILTFLIGVAFLEFILFSGGTISHTIQSDNFIPFLYIIIPSAILGIIGNLSAFSAGIKSPNPGFATAIQSGSILIVTFISVLFLGSSLSWFKLLGSLTVIIGVALLVINKIDKKDHGYANKELEWEILAVFAAIGFALMAIGTKMAYQLGFSALEINIFIFGINFIGFLILGHKQFRKWIQDAKRNKSFLSFIFIAGTFSFLGNLSTVKGLGLAPNPGYHEAIKYTQILFTTLASVPLLNATLNKQKLLGAITVLAGVIMIAIL
jgi:drug/metabolite transporter (DMT)-like permease